MLVQVTAIVVLFVI